ncbi:MAG: response regulator transcription factor [Rubrobacteraceae bacterium]
MTKILLVEDEAAMRDMVGYVLEREGMELEAAESGEAGLEVFQNTDEPFDLVILDVMLPGVVDGIEVCRRITTSSDVPVIMLTARDDETSVVVGLEVGADDYITKPFSPRELVSRVRAHLRRRRRESRPAGQQVLKFPGLEIDLLRHQVKVGENPVYLTAAQFRILTLLTAQPGRVYSRSQIMEPIWGSGFSGDSRAADVHIQNIRKHLEKDPKNPAYVLTVRGAGYKFAELPEGG